MYTPVIQSLLSGSNSTILWYQTISILCTQNGQYRTEICGIKNQQPSKAHFQNQNKKPGKIHLRVTIQLWDGSKPVGNEIYQADTIITNKEYEVVEFLLHIILKPNIYIFYISAIDRTDIYGFIFSNNAKDSSGTMVFSQRKK
jgi:hypothetical protein